MLSINKYACEFFFKKRYYSILFFIMTSLTLFAEAITLPPQNSTNWHPGHYFAPAYASGKIVQEDLFFNYVNSYNFRGVQLRYSWTDFETQKGVYNFSKLNNELAKLGPNKYMFVFLVTRSIGVDAHAVPAYMRTSEYGGGELSYSFAPNQTTRKGYLPVLWNAKVKERLKALITALGENLKANPSARLNKVEGIGATESSVGYPLKGSGVSFDETGYFQAYVTMLEYLKQSIPNKVHYQFLNFPRNKLNIVISKLCGLGSALGSPDIFIDEKGLNINGNPTSSPFQGLYQYYYDNKNKIPLIASVQPSDFQGNRSPFEGANYEPTLKQLNDFAINNLGANYLIWTWTKATFDHPSYNNYHHSPVGHLYWQDVLQFMSQPTQKNTPSGGLNATRPSCL